MKGEKAPLLRIDKKDHLPIALVALTLAGLAGKFLLALNTRLNSDMVAPGLQAMEVFKHGDTLLGNFYFPINYPGIFTDLIPFQLIPQLATNYDPDALRLMGFLIFVLTLAVYTAVIYKATGDQVKALLFMALLGNITPAAYSFFIQPVTHGATILIAGVLLFVLLDYEKLGLYQKILMAALVFLTAFSDDLALAIIAIPFTLALAYAGVRANRINPGTTILPAVYLFLPALAAYVLKSFLPRLVTMEITLITTYNTTSTAIGSLPDKILPYVGDMLSVFNDQLYAIINQKVGPLEILSLALVAVFIYSLWNVGKGYKKDSAGLKLFLLVLLAANALLFFGYILTSLSAARYLLFTSLSVLAIIALGYDKSKIYLALVAVVIALGIISCAIAVSQSDRQPNKAELGVINYLEENNLTFGYSDYWDSNIITYLSKENVRVRAINYKYGYMVPYKLLSSSRWYEEQPDQFFLLCQAYHDDGSIGAIVSSKKPDRTLQYENYYIFIYEKDSHPLINVTDA